MSGHNHLRINNDLNLWLGWLWTGCKIWCVLMPIALIYAAYFK